MLRLVCLASLCCATSSVKPITDANVRDAISSWTSGPAQAKADYGGAISEWNVGAVSNLHSAFSSKGIFNDNIGKWNVASVTSMYQTFRQALAFDQNLDGWNTGSVSNMQFLFDGAAAFNGDIASWNVARVATMLNLFNGASSFNRDISLWNLASVSSSENMFAAALRFNENIGGWNMASVTTMSGMFNRAIVFNRELLGWNVNRVVEMSYMFESAFGFSRDVSAWNVNSVTAMTQIFSSASLLSSRTKGCLWTYWGATLQRDVTNDLPWSSSAREECQAARCVDMCMHACSVCSCPRGRTHHTRTHTQTRSCNGSMESVGRCDSCIAFMRPYSRSRLCAIVLPVCLSALPSPRPRQHRPLHPRQRRRLQLHRMIRATHTTRDVAALTQHAAYATAH